MLVRADTPVGRALAALSTDELSLLAQVGSLACIAPYRPPWPHPLTLPSQVCPPFTQGHTTPPVAVRNVPVLNLWQQRWPTALQFAAWRRLAAAQAPAAVAPELMAVDDAA